MKVDRSDILAVANQMGDLLKAAQDSMPPDEFRKHQGYLAASAWRFAVTLAVLRKSFGRPLKGIDTLDIGAYPGHMAAILSQIDGARVTAVTLITNTEFEAFMNRLGARVALCDVERDRLPVEDGGAPVVLCSELIEHLDGDVVNMLQQARRAVSKDGFLLLTTPNHASIANRWALFRGRSVYPPLNLPDYPFYAGAGVRNPMRHVREFTAGEIESLLTGVGFGHVTIMTTSPPPGDGHPLSWRGRIARRLLRLWERLASNGGALLIAVARP